jgi:hypothetical protein
MELNVWAMDGIYIYISKEEAGLVREELYGGQISVGTLAYSDFSRKNYLG